MKKQRKHYTPEEKVAILMRRLLEKEPISERRRTEASTTIAQATAENARAVHARRETARSVRCIPQ